MSAYDKTPLAVRRATLNQLCNNLLSVTEDAIAIRVAQFKLDLLQKYDKKMINTERNLNCQKNQQTTILSISVGVFVLLNLYIFEIWFEFYGYVLLQYPTLK